MATLAPRREWRDLNLLAGEQAFINGALITAIAPVHLQVGSGAFVQRERPKAGRSREYAPARELYYRTLLTEAAGWPNRNHHAQLFALLGRCVLHFRTRESQEHCSDYAAALVSAGYDKALAAAHALALSDRIVSTEHGCAPTIGVRTRI